MSEPKESVGWLRALFIAPIKLYQLTLSRVMIDHCRFYPSCSHYAVESIETHGVWQGLRLASGRLLRCGPWHPGGFDPVPTRGEGSKQ